MVLLMYEINRDIHREPLCLASSALPTTLNDFNHQKSWEVDLAAQAHLDHAKESDGSAACCNHRGSY